MKNAGAEIKRRRAKLGWSTTKLATLAGISQSFLSRIESGEKLGSWETYMAIAGALGISVEELLPRSSNVERAPLGWRAVPVLDTARAGQWPGTEGRPTDADLRNTVLADLEHSPSTFAVQLRGDSMMPVFEDGDVVVIDPAVPPRPGDYVLASEDGGEGIFRQYRSAGVNERGHQVFELHPLNPIHAPMRSDRQPLAIVGVMVEHRRYRKR